MGQPYKQDFDGGEEKSSNQDSSPSGEKEGDWTHEHYETSGHSRFVSFIWPNGESVAFPYAYLSKVKFSIGEEYNEITFVFGSEKVTVRGFCLEYLLVALMEQRVRNIYCQEERYSNLDSSSEVQAKIYKITVSTLD